MQQRIKAIMARVFDLPADSIPDDASLGALKEWDSLGHITLMMAIEQELGVSLSADQMRHALTLPVIVDFVEQAATR